MMPLIKKLSEPKTLAFIGVAYTLFTTTILLMPGSEIPQIKIAFIDKITHVFIHVFLSFIWLAYAFSWDKYPVSVKKVSVVLLACFSYGIVIEVVQLLFIPTRSYDAFDIIANGFGSVIGLLIYRAFRNTLSNA